MKTTRKNAPVKILTEAEKLAAYLDEQMTGKESGEINLDAIVKANPLVPKYDIVKVLKARQGGEFVAGRRGHASRWVFGKAITHSVPRLTATAMGLKITLGNVEKILPLKMDLVSV